MTPRAADLVLRSARIWDETDRTDADSIAVRDGRVLAVGPAEEVVTAAGPGTEIVDVGGRRVIPGLIDSHIHLVRAGRRWASDVRWEGVGSLMEGMERIRDAAGRREPGEWVVVMGGWHPGQLHEARGPTQAELDAAAADHPVYVQRGYAEAFLNTSALAELAVSSHADGRVADPAVVAELAKRLPMPAFADQVSGTRAMLRHLNSLGLTGAIDAGGFGMTPDAYDALFAVWGSGERGFRTRLLVGSATPGREFEELESWARYVRPGFGDEYLRYLGAGEVLLYAAHDMEGVDGRDVGEQADRLAELSTLLASAGWPVHAHAILDTSVSAVLDAWERVDRAHAVRDLRFTITHAEQVGERNLERMSDLGIGVTVQHRVDYRGPATLESWGEAQIRRSPPLRDLIELGVPLGAGTDATVASSYRPWQCLWWLVTGGSVTGIPPRDPEHRLTRDEALRLYTSGAAWFSFEEQERGRLTPGSLADLAVLSEDFLTVPEERIPAIASELTMVGGRIVHAGPDLTRAGVRSGEPSADP